MTNYKKCVFCGDEATTTVEAEFNPPVGDVLYVKKLNACEYHSDEPWLLCWDEEKQYWYDGTTGTNRNAFARPPTKEEIRMAMGETLKK